MSKKRESVLKKNDEINLEITALTSQGSGVGRFNSMAVFVEGTAPGDLIIAHIILVKSNYAVGIIKKILKPSKHRIVCDCGAFSSCGGCSFRHIDYDEELAFKKQRVQDAFSRIGGIDTQVKEILTAGKVERYRNKAQYPVAMTPEGKTLIGFYAKKSHRVIDCRDCLLQPEEFETFLRIVEKWAAQYGVTIYNEKEKKGLLRHIYIRKGFKTGQIMICIVSTSRVVPKIEKLADELISSNVNIKSIVLNVNSEDTNVVLSTDCITLWGSGFIEDELCGLKFKISPLSFFQVNPEGAEILYKKAAEYAALSGEETLLDLYCGTGTIGLSMAKNAKRVIGVEIIPQAIEDAKENAKENGICNAEFFCDDASGAAKRISESGTKIDVIVLDPPRKGCSKDVIEAVTAMNPKRIVYVSCDPATLARDCAEFKKAGFETDEITAVDMFPRTTHVETVALLTYHRQS
ncbi:MAG: 23S rRNA (uracil(1939)-C(5))-methyltransferase RlmD [Clostridia bacterium]|nr:23S rRNA (uracil(1939)-C(5))-methyltransferase RlmD [Clostridia bacterium]